MDNKLTKLQNKDAEKNIIAELINNNESLANIQNLKPEHFSSKKHREIYSKILELSQDNKPADLVTLSNELEGVSVSDLTYFIGESISSVKIKEYEKIIISNWIRRNLLILGYEFINGIQKPGINPGELVSETSTRFDDILSLSNQSEKIGSIESALNELIEQRVDGVTKSKGIKTKYPGIDNRTGGFQPGDLVVIGGATSTGKTALALNIIENILFGNTPCPIGYISLELGKTSLLDRLICSKSEINIDDFYHGKVTSKIKNKYQKTASEINNKPFYILDNVSTIPDIKTKINLLHKNYKIRVVFIDNLQNILGNAGQDFRKLISEATRELKATARRLNISIVALSHLSRSQDNSKPPRLSDLKESSSIEQDADKVFLIHRPYKDAGLSDYKEECILKFAKNRQGHTGRIELIFNRKIARFENPAEDKDPGF